MAVPLSLTGAPTRRRTLMDLAGRVARLARERGVSGPVGRALEAARLLSIAALDQDAAVSTYVDRVVDLATEAEVLAACVHGQDASLARATAEMRALAIAQPSRGRP